MLNSLFAYIASTTAVGMAGWLVLHDKGGWGWFLFIAVILYPMGSTNE